MSTLKLEKSISFKTYHLFLLLLLGIFINIWITQNYIMTREVYHNLLSEQLEISRIDDYFNLVQKFSIWAYVLTPIIFLIRITFVSLLIQFPLIMKFIDIPLKQIFRIVTFAFIPLFFMSVLKTIWLLLLPTHQITQETLSFTPLAFTNFLNASNYGKTVHGLLSNLNVFEVGWCIIVAEGLSRTRKTKKIGCLYPCACCMDFNSGVSMGFDNVFDKNKFLIEFLRYLIVVVFFVSAAMKIADFFNTSYFFSNTFGFSINTAKYLLFLLISIELFLGLTIISRVSILQTIYSMTIVLLIVFILIELGFIYKGIDNCGCFGTVWKMDPITSIIKTFVLIFIILILKRNLKRENIAS